MDSYKQIINSVKSDPDLSASIGNVSENFAAKESMGNQVKYYVLSELLIAVTLTYLIISFLVKGVSKKVGILKALGISDKTIIFIFIGGLTILLAFSFLISIAADIIVYTILNREYSKFLGFAVEKYKLSAEGILLQVMSALILLFSVYGIIQYKITRLSPNMCMSKK
jgi:predicted lysophospholipase L1 biosynthesis ABC-type transport system permease subunit